MLSAYNITCSFIKNVDRCGGISYIRACESHKSDASASHLTAACYNNIIYFNIGGTCLHLADNSAGNTCIF